MSQLPKKIIVIAGYGWSLVNFRIELLKRMVANGHDVLALAPDIDEPTAAILEKWGIRHGHVRMNRTGTNPVQDFQTFVDLYRIFKKEKPDHIVPYTMKPIVYGGMAARLAGVPNQYALFTGLGYAFMEENPTGKRALVRATTVRLHRLALKSLKGAFYYNPSEEQDIRKFRLVPDSVPLHAVPGSGVDTSLFNAPPPPTDPVRFIMICRLLKSKGIPVLVEASRRLKAQGLKAEVCILGPMDTNPDAVTRVELDQWVSEGVINYLGETRDVRPFLQDSGVFVLPTVLREGVPRTILEAMACGRAVITTDAPGCGTTIRDGETGFVVPSHDAERLAEAMAKFIRDPSLITQMGAAGRKLACDVYDVHKINRLLLTTMGLEGEVAPQLLTEELGQKETAAAQ
ncbi:glycosyltransferase family 4 protein [Actibacterium lipolyticum]|uniref:N, N'-diacetylbacillosaminyl-diphospho-undecaprenol alpha-1,3-N-acetylgalactosaminyltransferase n=1 Tax=Actibacterium lipolyticum TaxID=1524263 RepID=A0A238KXC9_9RHOB|nr:glycosyltransferase family 4 protein [Actibacterium lipolyticum]SMX47348.1 N, N'-diacetylbacillosaminyl-diphospho-undecaprenol alpha-1,3-N-acetylgalactosaminyltransferase [Actibacterium lipolyticum]